MNFYTTQMRSGPAATVGLLLGLTLILAACGNDQTTAAGRKAGAVSTAPTVKIPADPNGGTSKSPAAKRCGRSLGDFLDSMESLTNTLAVGLDYEGYIRALSNVRATYASLRAKRLSLVCLARVAGPAERALNVYIESANKWGECLASTSCDPEAVEPKLQREWAQASSLLGTAQRSLRTLD